MGNFLLIVLICWIAWWIIKKIHMKLNEPPAKEGTLLRFRECLNSLDMDEAQRIALAFDEPYKTRMLKQAWAKFSSRSAERSDYSLFFWLEKLAPDLRENIAPGEYRSYGIKTIKASIPHSCDWQLVEKTGYELSVSELRKLAKNGNQRAIDILNRA